MSDFLQMEGRNVLVMGVANRKSVAWHVAKLLRECGATVVYSVRSEQRRESLAKLLGGAEVHVCDVEHEDQVQALASAGSRPRSGSGRPPPRAGEE